MAATAARYGVDAGRLDGYPGCWCDSGTPSPRKLGALGLRVERGVSYHGIALNVTTRLEDYELIDPCGMPHAVVTSIAREAGWPAGQSTPSTESVRQAAEYFAQEFTTALESAAAASRASRSTASTEPTRATEPALAGMG